MAISPLLCCLFVQNNVIFSQGKEQYLKHCHPSENLSNSRCNVRSNQTDNNNKWIPNTALVSVVLTDVFPLSSAACKDHRKAMEVSQNSEEMGLILGVCAGGLIVLILVLGAVIIIIKKG